MPERIFPSVNSNRVIPIKTSFSETQYCIGNSRVFVVKGMWKTEDSTAKTRQDCSTRKKSEPLFGNWQQPQQIAFCCETLQERKMLVSTFYSLAPCWIVHSSLLISEVIDQDRTSVLNVSGARFDFLLPRGVLVVSRRWRVTHCSERRLHVVEIICIYTNLQRNPYCCSNLFFIWKNILHTLRYEKWKNSRWERQGMKSDTSQEEAILLKVHMAYSICQRVDRLSR